MPHSIRAPIGVSTGQLLGIDASQIQTITSGTAATIGAGIRLVLVSTAAGNFTLTGGAVVPGHIVRIVKTSTDANTITYARAGTETINAVAGNYALQSSDATVNPWWDVEDTSSTGRWVQGTPALATTTTPGTMSAADKAKLDKVTSGTYTPTGTGVTNLDSITPGVCMYARIGDTVYVNGLTVIDPTANALSQWRLTLPIASNFGAVADLSGGAVSGTAYLGWAYGDAGNDAAAFDFGACGTAGTNVRFWFSYRVI